MTDRTLRIDSTSVQSALWVTTRDQGTLATVLHVEDDPNDALLLKLAFRRTHLPVSLQHVTDGQQAVNYLSGTASYADRLRFPFPGLVLLDLKLPLIDGFGVLAWA